MKKIIITCLLTANIFAAIISGNQHKVSITGGSMDVTSGGSTITVNAGEMTTYGENLAPSKAKKVGQGDMNDVTNDLEPSSSDIDMIKIKTEPINPNIARQIRLELIRQGINREYINLLNVNNGTQIFIDPIPLSTIKQIYNSHHKIARDFFRKTSNEGKVPTLNIKEVDLQKYHKVIFQKNNQN